MTSGSGGPPVEVFFYGDYGCPFTYLADRRLERLGAERKLAVHWRPLAVHPETREALQAAEFARDLGGDAFRRLHAALFAAAFLRGADLGDREVLLDVAEETGLDRTALENALADGRYEAELEMAAAEADRYGITGTPAFLFGRFKVVGAAPIPELRRAADRAAGAAGAG